MMKRCKCGEWSGEMCSRKVRKPVIVEWIPTHLVASHEAARNRGCWPYNGAFRTECAKECAEYMLANDETASIVKSMRAP